MDVLVSHVKCLGRFDKKYSPSLGTYISETSHKSMRRILGTFPGVGVTVGKLLAYVVALIFPDWRDSALALSQVPLLASMTMLLFPETPYWLASVGKLQDSRYGYHTFKEYQNKRRSSLSDRPH